MKLAPRTFRIFWDVHAWTGIVAALLLHVIFFTGAISLFREELDTWANDVPAGTRHLERQPLNPLLARLAREESIIGKRLVAFVPGEHGLRAYWRAGDQHRDFRTSPVTGKLERSGSELGSFLYAMHFFGPIPNGVYVAGGVSLLLVLVLVTGLSIHLKDVVRQWFQFRPERPTRTWSSDLHKVLGVFGLPYQLLYAWSGAVLCLGWVTVEPAFTATVFGGNERAQAVARGESAAVAARPTGKLSNELPDLDRLVASAEAKVPGLVPSWIGIEAVGDEASTVRLYGEVPGIAFGSVEAMFRARDGALLSLEQPRAASSFQRFEAWFYGLHYADFGGLFVKLLYFALALASSAVIVTGNLVWIDRRDPLRRSRGNRVLEGLTVSFGAGVIVATAAMFVANRMLAPRGNQAVLEQSVFFGAWSCAALLPFVWRRALRSTGALLILSAVLFFLALGLDLLRATDALGSPLRRGVDLALALAGAACLLAGLRLLYRKPRTASASPSEPQPTEGALPPVLTENRAIPP